jgi:hypothetical protein
VVISSDVSGQPIRPTFKGRESKKKAGKYSTGFIQGRVWAVTNSKYCVPANRVDAGVWVLIFKEVGGVVGRRTM